MAEFPVNVQLVTDVIFRVVCNVDTLETPSFRSAEGMATFTMEYPVMEYYVILTWEVPQDVFWSGEQNASCQNYMYLVILLCKNKP